MARLLDQTAFIYSYMCAACDRCRNTGLTQRPVLFLSAPPHRRRNTNWKHSLRAGQQLRPEIPHHAQCVRTHISVRTCWSSGPCEDTVSVLSVWQITKGGRLVGSDLVLGFRNHVWLKFQVWDPHKTWSTNILCLCDKPSLKWDIRVYPHESNIQLCVFSF